MKSSNNKLRYVPATRTHKVLCVVALAGLFACGLMLGLSWRPVPMADSASNVADVETTNVVTETVDVAPVAEHQDFASLSLCQKIESLLLDKIYESDMSYVHDENARVYQQLAENGCLENQDRFKSLAAEEAKIAAVLRTANHEDTEINVTEVAPCVVIERALSDELSLYRVGNNFRQYMDNAYVYANMAVKGCSENAQKYVDLARNQLSIAQALMSPEESDREQERIEEINKLIKSAVVATPAPVATIDRFLIDSVFGVFGPVPVPMPFIMPQHKHIVKK